MTQYQLVKTRGRMQSYHYRHRCLREKNGYLFPARKNSSPLKQLVANRVFHDFATAEECQYCQLHFGSAIQNKKDQ